MKKKINFHGYKKSKQVLIIIICSVFLIYISIFLAEYNRNYIISEKLLKNISSTLNSYVINKTYSKSKFNKDVLSSKVAYLQKENAGLRRILNLSNENSNYVISEVVNRVASSYLNKVDIAKGYKDDIKKGSAVINEDGLVGFVNSVSKNVSEVNLITGISDGSNIPVSIKIGDKYISGILNNYDSKKNLFEVTGLLSSYEIEEGAIVLLSEYNNTNKGIYIGKVKKQKTTNFGLNKTIWVKSDVDFNNILFVAVVVESKW